MGVFVIGMHRSGTSAATELLAAMGLDVGDPAALMEADEGNRHGFFELVDLAAVNDEILSDLGGDALAPPGPEKMAGLADFPDERVGSLIQRFESYLGSDGWVWKDPRNCLLLGFWRELLPGEHQAVVVLRNPTTIADSLLRRGDAVTPSSAVALWERYMRSARTHLAGMPTIVTDYDSLVTSPDTWCRTVSSFLNSVRAGVPLDPGEAAGLVDPSLRRSKVITMDLSPEQLALEGSWRGLVGGHEGFPRIDEGTESPRTTFLLDERTMFRDDRLIHQDSRRELLEVIDGLASELESRQTVHDGLVGELENLQEVITGLRAELHLREEMLGDAAEELQRRRHALDDAADELSYRQRLLDQFIRQAPTGLVSSPTAANHASQGPHDDSEIEPDALVS